MKYIPMRRYTKAFSLSQQCAINGTGGSYPVDIPSVIAAASERILLVSSREYKNFCRLRRLDFSMPQHAYTVYLPTGKLFLIVYNERFSDWELRFSLAREVGHILLGHLTDGTASTADFTGYNHQEREANAFAGALLAPPILIDHLLNGRAYSPAKVARHFGLPLKQAQGPRRLDYGFWRMQKRLLPQEIALAMAHIR